MIGEKKICQNEKMLVGIGHMCVPPHTYGMLLFDSLPEMLFLHTISSWGSARVSPPTFALLAHRRPAIKNPPKKRKKNQAAAAAALPKKTTRSITHALLHFIWEEKSQQQQDIFIRDATSLFFPYGRVKSLLVPKRRRRRDMPLRGALNTISTSICVYGAAATCCHFLLLASAAFSNKKKNGRNARATWSLNLLPLLKRKCCFFFFFFCFSWWWKTDCEVETLSLLSLISRVDRQREKIRSSWQKMNNRWSQSCCRFSFVSDHPRRTPTNLPSPMTTAADFVSRRSCALVERRTDNFIRKDDGSSTNYNGTNKRRSREREREREIQAKQLILMTWQFFCFRPTIFSLTLYI